MSEPVVGYESIITVSNVSASAEETDFPAVTLANPLTFDRFRAPSSADVFIYIDLDTAVPCDYFALAAHNLGTLAAQVAIYGNTVSGLAGSPVTLAVLSQVASDAPLLERFASASYAHWTIAISAGSPSEADAVDIGALFVGAAMAFERCIMNSYAPLPYNRDTMFYDNTSDNGQFLGRSIKRRGYESTVSFKLMTAAWVRSTFQGFVRSARRRPYFFQWNPTLYPSEVAYVRTADDIGVTYTGDRDRMSASWKMQGIGYDD